MKLTDRIVIEELLDWVYNVADSQCGIKSNWESCINVAQYGYPSLYQDNYNEGLILALSKRRSIEKRLRLLSEKDQRVLYYTYSFPQFDKYVKLYFGEYTGAVFGVNPQWTPTEADQIIKLCRIHKMSGSKLTAAQHQTLIKLKLEAMQALNSALDNFKLTKRK